MQVFVYFLPGRVRRDQLYLCTVDDEEGNDTAVKVRTKSGDEQSTSTVVNIAKVESSTAVENISPDSTMQLVDSLNSIQANLVVKTTSRPSKLVTHSLQSLISPPSPVTHCQPNLNPS